MDISKAHFNKAASCLYRSLTTEEKEELMQRMRTTDESKLSTWSVKRRIKTVSQRIQNLVCFTVNCLARLNVIALHNLFSFMISLVNLKNWVIVVLLLHFVVIKACWLEHLPQ